MTGALVTLDHPTIAQRTGRGVRIAVVDSGIQPAHPHVAGALEGLRVTGEGEDADTRDGIGHGTAVAAAIREKAPGAELLPVRVFDETLTTTSPILARAIRAASARGARLVNVSMGTTTPDSESVLHDAVQEAMRAHALVIAPREADGVPSWPGCIEGVVGVVVDTGCPRDALRLTLRNDGEVIFEASGLPRPIPGVPPARNLQGVSFATANVTGFLARLLEAEPSITSVHQIVQHLRQAAPMQASGRRLR